MKTLTRRRTTKTSTTSASPARSDLGGLRSYPGGVRIKAGVGNVATRGAGVLVKWGFLAAKGGDLDFEVLAAVGRLMPLTVPDVLTQLRCCLAISVASLAE